MNMSECSSVTKGVVTASMIFAGACVVYLILTRPVGTPFMDSLTPEQRAIKKESARVRYNAFAMGIVITSMVVLCARPLG